MIFERYRPIGSVGRFRNDPDSCTTVCCSLHLATRSGPDHPLPPASPVRSIAQAAKTGNSNSKKMSEKISSSDGAPAEAPQHHADLVTTGDDGVVLASEADAELLAKMGYKQELKRNFSTLEVFGIAFSIMGLLPSIASTLAFSLPAGPAGMVWSWFLASGCIFVVGLAMADLGSAMPTTGGLYYWTHYFSSPKTRNYLCFLVGYSNSLGLIGGLCSINCKRAAYSVCPV